MQIGDYDFVQTCGSCPEQYDVFDKDGNQVAYVRLRHGILSATAPNVGGMDIYLTHVGGGWTGSFESDKQRRIYLGRIAHRIIMLKSDIRCPECNHQYYLNHPDLDWLDDNGEGTFVCPECNYAFIVKFAERLIGLSKECSGFDRSALTVVRGDDE